MEKRKKNIVHKLMNNIKESFEKRQELPNQYVVVYKKMGDDSVFGYHSSTMCVPVEDILDAKRYAGDNPYKQLMIIAKNLRSVVSVDIQEPVSTLEGISAVFEILKRSVKEKFYKDIGPEDLYIDAVYLGEGMPKQEFKFTLLEDE